jgi:prepilin-type N-terminal cleavage/methylation domain-containing protein
MTRRFHAFTLVELLVVIAIIGLLVSLLLPALGKARDQAGIIGGLANLRSISQATHIYITDNRQLLPIPWTDSALYTNSRRFMANAAGTWSAPSPGLNNGGGLYHTYADELIDGNYIQITGFADKHRPQLYDGGSPVARRLVKETYPDAPQLCYLATSFPSISSMNIRYGGTPSGSTGGFSANGAAYTNNPQHIPFALVRYPSESMWVMDGYFGNTPPMAVPYGYLSSYRDTTVGGAAPGHFCATFFDAHAELIYRPEALSRVGDPGITTNNDRFFPDPIAAPNYRRRFWDFVHDDPKGNNPLATHQFFDNNHTVSEKTW